MTRKLIKNERGAALLETAITIPIVLVICVAVFEFGRAFQTWQVLTNAAREGARVAVIVDKTDADVTKTVQDYLTAGVLKSAPTININRNLPLGTNTGSQITVNYPFDFMVLNPVMKLVNSGSTAGASAFTMQATAVMRNEI
jgi:Flp pilus assembly protein TadG